jgi:hypothetical protein
MGSPVKSSDVKTPVEVKEEAVKGTKEVIKDVKGK